MTLTLVEPMKVVDMTQECRDAYYHDGPTACVEGQRHSFTNAIRERRFVRSVKVAKGKGFKKPVYRDEYETSLRTLDGFFRPQCLTDEYGRDTYASKFFVCVHCGLTASVTANKKGTAPTFIHPAKLVPSKSFRFTLATNASARAMLAGSDVNDRQLRVAVDMLGGAQTVKQLATLGYDLLTLAKG